MNADAPTPPPSATDPAAPPVADTPLLPAPEPPPPAPVAIVWPNWFRPFDIALGILAVVLAFLLGSFVARNADLWRHLAAGRLVTQFNYPWGGDPFTFTAADRPWVNANWLGEVLLYLLHSVDGSGAIAVGVKAVAVAAAVGLLFLLRKPGAPLWPWAVAAAAGAVALAGFTHLRPQVFALPILAGILAVLYTADWGKGSKWRVPAVLGGLTAVWANVDSFAFLSPLLVGLLLVGEWLHPKVFPKGGDLPPTEDPFRPTPPRDALLRALLLCVVGVLLNPTFVAAVFRNPGEAFAQLVPFELDWQAAEHLKPDADLNRITFSALNQTYLENPVLGQNPSGMFVIGLWVAAALAAGVGFRHGRLSHLLAWVVFTLLGAVVHARFVPYGVLVGVPFLAAHLNGLGRYVPTLLDKYPQAGRGVLMACKAGRILCLVAVVALLVSAVPGWLHPWNGSAAGRRYVGWGVVPDEGMKRSGELFAEWHDDPARKEVLNSVRGLNTHPDLGDYLAYFAPAEKSFVTSRYRLHRAELKDLVEVRKGVFARWSDDASAKPPVETDWLLPVADKYGLGYVSVAQTEVRPDLSAVLNVRMGFGVRLDEEFRYGPPWHLDGRLLVIGRSRSLTEGEQRRYNQRATLPKEEAEEVVRMEAEARRRPQNRVMAWDVAREVFGPRTPPPAPPPMTQGVHPLRGWEYDLLLLYPPPTPVGLDDAESLSAYAEQLFQRRGLRDQLRQTAWQRQVAAQTNAWQTGMAAAAGVPVPVAVTLAAQQGANLGPVPVPPQPTPDPPGEQEYALPYLIARSAREALALDPNAPFGHFALGLANANPFMPATEPPADLFGFAPIPPYDPAQRMMQALFSDLRTRYVVFPPFGPSEREVQLLTALNRAVARLPEATRPADEYTGLNVRTRVLLVNSYLHVGHPQPYFTVRRLPNNQLQMGQGNTSPIGYIDAARTALLELKQLLENARPEDAMPAARALVPLWDRVLSLCLADFWITFPQLLQSGQQVPNDWWDKINRGDLLPLLVDRSYINKDDWNGWQDAFAKDASAGKVDVKVLRARVERLYSVLDNLVGVRLGRLPRAVERPAEHYMGAIASGLPETALKMVVDKEDDKKVSVDATSADVIRLLLWVGRAETANAYFAKEQQTMEETDMPADRRAVERAKFRLVEYELAKLNGDYAKADVLYTELLATPLGPPPPVPMTALMFADLWRPVVYTPLTDAELKQYAAATDLVQAGNVLGGGPVAVTADITLTAFRIRLLFQATTHYQRGVYALLGGDPARAREHFEKAADPQGVGKFLPPLPADASKEAKELLPVERLGLPPSVAPTFGQVLPKYLELLKKYEKK